MLQHPKANPQAQINFQQKISAYQQAGTLMVDLNESGLAQDWQAIGRMNASGALMGMTFLTIALFDGRLNWDVFMPGWARSQDLLAQTAAGTVFVMDHASLDKGHEMLEAISANQCLAEFLPAYSPDLNRMEHKWAPAKAIRRQYRCGVDKLFSKHSQYVVL